MTIHRAPAHPVGADLLRLLKTLKLGALADTLPERAALARQHKLSHIGFLETLLADEVSRRESRSAALRATKAGLDPSMRFDTWTAHDDLRYDRTLLGDLTALRFLDAGQSAIVLGPVGVGKTHLATALGHIAIRRRHTVLFSRADKLSPDCAPPDSTTPSTPRSADWLPSTSSSSTTSPCGPSTPPKPATSTKSSSNARPKPPSSRPTETPPNG
jgi:IstB-like ATP binding protein